MDLLPRFSRSLRASLRLDVQRNTNHQTDEVVVNLWHEENERAKYVQIATISDYLSANIAFWFIIS